MQETEAKPVELNQHESNKMLRERLGHAHYIMSYQCKYLPEQFEEVGKTLSFIKEVCETLQAKIEEVEPPKKFESEPPKPYVMDLPQGTQVSQ